MAFKIHVLDNIVRHCPYSILGVPADNTATSDAPATFKVIAATDMVAPVVITSSIIKMFRVIPRLLQMNALDILSILSVVER